MDDNKLHIFNVYFQMETSACDPYYIANVKTFQVYPVYWTAEIIKGRGQVTGQVFGYAGAVELVTASLTSGMTTSACAVPTMSYSASVVITGSTLFSSCPIVLEGQTYVL